MLFRMNRPFLGLAQQGISEKVALVISPLGAFFTGYILAFARSCRLSRALLTMYQHHRRPHEQVYHQIYAVRPSLG
jgi:hypothetical protein